MSDDVLVRRLGDLVRRDNLHAAQLLRHIDEVDRRMVWAKLGHPSMFDFCVRRYHMSESVAGKRIGAARTARRFPVLFDMVGRGEIHLSGIHRLKAHLTPANHREVLAQAKHMSLRDIEALAARLAPQPGVPSRLRALPRPQSGRAVTLAGDAALGGENDGAAGSVATAPSAFGKALEAKAGDRADDLPAAAGHGDRGGSWAVGSRQGDLSGVGSFGQQASVVGGPVVGRPHRSPDPMPLAPRRYKLEVTLDEAACADLRALQDLLAHDLPNGDPAVIVTRALHELRERVVKTKAALTDSPRQARRRSNERVRSIPAHIRRAVWQRDAGRCGFVGADGRRCNATRQLEFAHVRPWAKGGEHSVANVGLRCRAHNGYEAIRDYGAEFMARKKRRGVSGSEEAGGARAMSGSEHAGRPSGSAEPGGGGSWENASEPGGPTGATQSRGAMQLHGSDSSGGTNGPDGVCEVRVRYDVHGVASPAGGRRGAWELGPRLEHRWHRMQEGHWPRGQRKAWGAQADGLATIDGRCRLWVASEQVGAT